VGVERAQLRVGPDEPGGGDARVLGLVDALVRPRPGWALNAPTTFASSCSFGEPAVAGRFGSPPSHSQQWSPCAAAASSSAFSAAICASICCALQSARPVRTKLAPPALSSCQASLPSGVEPPSGGGFEKPIGKTFCP